MRTEPLRSWLDLLASLAPAQTDIELLRALLWEGDSARARWTQWASAVGDPRAHFEREYLGRKGLLAFLAHRISVSGLEVGDAFATYARVAQVREELRSRILFETLGVVQAEMGRAGLAPVLINGAAYALTVYAEPLVRHNHGIDLVLSDGEMGEARRCVTRAGFRAASMVILPRGALETFRHRTGLELTLRPRLFLAPHVVADPAGFRSRARDVATGQFRVRVLDPTDRICHTLGECAPGPTRRNLRWACDAYLLLGHADAPNFDRLIATAGELGIALSSAVLLEFFRSELGSPVPSTALEALRSRGAPRSRAEAALLLSTGLRSSASVDEFVERASHGPLFARAARFAFLPTAEHIAYQQRPAGHGRLPLLYAARFARLLLRPFRSRGRLRPVVP